MLNKTMKINTEQGKYYPLKIIVVKLAILQPRHDEPSSHPCKYHHIPNVRIHMDFSKSKIFDH